MAKFCGNCGASVSDTAKHCPQCGNPVVTRKNATPKAAQPPAKKSSPSKFNKILFLKITAIVLSVLIVIGVGTCTLAYFDIVNVPYISDTVHSLFPKKTEPAADASTSAPESAPTEDKKDPVDSQPNTSVPDDLTPIDAEAYLSTYATILSKEKADASLTVQSEEAVTDFLRERGFYGITVKSSYTIDGTYYPAETISGYSSTLHPVYTVEYAPEDDVLWLLTITNGNITANPVYHNLTLTDSAPVLLAETDYVVSYDNITNMFYKITPKDTTSPITQVPRIDRETLDTMFAQGGDVE